MGLFEDDVTPLHPALAARRESRAVATAAPPAGRGGPAAAQATGPQQAITMLLRYWKVIAACIVASVLVALAALALLAPVYEADALVQVEQGPRNDTRSTEDPVATMTGQQAPVSAEIELLRSRLVLGTVVESLRLGVEVEPHRLPLVGRWIAAHPAVGDRLAAALGSRGGFAWGEAHLDIGRIVLPPSLHDVPLRLEIIQDGRFRLDGVDGEILAGVVGTAVTAVRADGEATLEVTRLQGATGTVFDVVLHSRADTLRSVLEDFRVAEVGKDSGLIKLSYRGGDPQLVADVVNGAAREYQAQDVSWRNAKAARTLAFLDGQLPALRTRVENAEAALTLHKRNVGGPDLTAETTLLLQQSVATDEVVQKLEQQRRELEQRFTPDHPSMLAVLSQIRQATGKRVELEQRIARLPGSQRQLASLTRDVEVNMRLYISLLDEIQKLGVAKAGTLGAVRIVDPALVPPQPTFPQPVPTLAAALIAGILLGGGVAVLLAATRRRVDGLADLAHFSSARCLAVLAPFRGRGLWSRLRGAPDAATSRASDDIRRLRAALLTDPVSGQGGVILVAGLSADAGHRDVLLALGGALSGAALRTVLVDLDLHSPGLGEPVRPEAHAGVSEWLTRRVFEVEGVVQAGTPGQPDRVPAGGVCNEARELLAPPRLRSLLHALRQRYDYVLVHVPALTAFTEYPVVASVVDGVILVGRHRHLRGDLLQGVERGLAEAGARHVGTVLTDVRGSDRMGHLDVAWS